MSILLYALTVLIWGTSWIMFELQTGPVAAEVSTAYRFGASAVIILVWALARRERLRFNLQSHFFLVLEGAFLFCFNLFFIYLAARYLPSGLNAVVFSMSSVLTMALTAVYGRKMPPATALAGALVGVLGVGVIFWPAIARLLAGEASDAVLGLGLSLTGTTCFVLGGIIAARNQKAGLNDLGSITWAMGYGTAIMCGVALVRGNPFTFDTGLPYVLSLVWLIIIASVIAFAVYFALLKRIGAERAAYSTVLFPVVALIISTVFEDYQWTATAMVGVALTLAGNVLVLRRGRQGDPTR